MTPVLIIGAKLIEFVPSKRNIDAIAAKFHEEKGAYKLLVIDSIMALFRVDFTGRGELSERQQKLAQFLSRVQKIAEEYNVAVWMTNQMTADPGIVISYN